ncbi:MAG: hypothetical protein NC921_04085 [Candidatus Omnitrophica bacterium]|nr:hypothetical protein [Candidatus Omnitrophota bacterium]
MENQVGSLNIDNEIKQITDFLLELYETFKEIPFGNSDFQNKYFVINSQITKGRAFRALCLRLRDRINALLEAYYNLKKEDIDLEELQEKLEKETNPYEKRRIELDIAYKKLKRIDIKKLVDDALHEVNFLLSLYKQFPKITREQFELEEEEHFKKRLKIQMLEPNLQSLLDMGYMLDEKGNIKPANEEWKFNVYEEIKKLDGHRK